MTAAFPAAVWAETRKLRRSPVPWLTAAGLSLAPLMSGLFVLAARDPQGTTGLLGGKTQALEITADWAGYFALLLQIDAIGGTVAFGVLTAWVFGREFSDRTAVDLLALPTPRAAIVTAKFAVVAVGSAVLTALVLALGLAVGGVLGLPGWSAELLLVTVGDLAVLAGLSIALVTPVALAACIGRGYLPAIGLTMVVIPLATVLASVGVGGWFPWSVPALAGGIAGPAAAAGVGVASYLLVGITAIAGAVLTVTWWQLADHQ